MILNKFLNAGALAMLLSGPAQAVTLQDSYAADVVFADALFATTMTIAFDGRHYWSTSGGSTTGVRYAQYGAGGGLIETFAPGIDFRSVFMGTGGEVLVREFANADIVRQTAPAQFTTHITLSGAVIDPQSSVVQNDAGEYVAMEGGIVQRFDAGGQFVGSFNLNGYVDPGYPGNRGIAVAGDYLLTYDDTQTLSVWNYSGALLDTTSLEGAGTTFDSLFSFGYTNDRVFIVDVAGGQWRGFNLGLTSTSYAIAPVPLPASGLVLLAGLLTVLVPWQGKRAT